MKVAYLIAALVFTLGFGLLIFGTTSSAEVTLLGVTFHSRIAKGFGLITMIFSIIAFLSAFGGAQPSSRVGRRG